jgi:hypothetical protein
MYGPVPPSAALPLSEGVIRVPDAEPLDLETFLSNFGMIRAKQGGNP